MSLEKLRTARCIAGIHQVCKAVQSGAAEAVFIASDADDRVLAALLAACAAASCRIVGRHEQSWANMPALT